MQITENPRKIWSSELDDPTKLDSESQKNDLYTILVAHLKRLCRERDAFAHKVVEITLASPIRNGTGDHGSDNGGESYLSPEKNHLALEVAESKAKIRKLNQLL